MNSRTISASMTADSGNWAGNGSRPATGGYLVGDVGGRLRGGIAGEPASQPAGDALTFSQV
jgi:hypothetical protein